MEEEVKSKLLKENWHFIEDVYIKLKNKSSKTQKGILSFFKSDQEDLSFKEVYDVLLNEWKIVYPKFVLEPIREDVLELFFKAQNTDFTQNNELDVKQRSYYVHYYLCQYFSLGIIPNGESNNFPDMSLNTSNYEDKNLELYEVFEAIYTELNFDSLTEEELFDDNSEFYQAEVVMLRSFLSECWNETKLKTNLDVKGVLIESTGADDAYSLDDNLLLE